MKIILLKPIPKLGQKDDIVDVAHGYARNFLLAKGLAVEATKQVLLAVAEKRKRQERKHDDLAQKNARLRKILAQETILARASANPEGVLFGGVGPDEIVKNIAKRKKIQINPKDIYLPHHLKTLGRHEVVLKLRGGEEVKFFVEIEREDK